MVKFNLKHLVIIILAIVVILAMFQTFQLKNLQQKVDAVNAENDAVVKAATTAKQADSAGAVMQQPVMLTNAVNALVV